MNTLSVDTTGMRELTVAETKTVAGGHFNRWQEAGIALFALSTTPLPVPPQARAAAATAGVGAFAIGTIGAAAGWRGWGFGRIYRRGGRKQGGAKIKFV